MTQIVQIEGGYYPLSKQLHKDYMSLLIFCSYIEKIKDGCYSKESIEEFTKDVKIPDIDKSLVSKS